MTDKILVLGGTQMIGRDFVELCQSSGIKPYLANRGRTNRGLFPDLDHIFIDRNNPDQCINLKNYQFDTVVDFSAYTLDQFINTIRHIQYTNYIFISSSCSDDKSVLSNVNHQMYKYCFDKQTIEQYITTNIKNYLIVKPCIVFGKNDYTNRFYQINDTIYFSNTNTETINNEYYLDVRRLTNYLLDRIFSFMTGIVSINGINISVTE